MFHPELPSTFPAPLQISQLFRRHPSLFAWVVRDPANLRAIFDWFRDLGLGQDAVLSMLSKMPLLLQMDVESGGVQEDYRNQWMTCKTSRTLMQFEKLSSSQNQRTTVMLVLLTVPGVSALAHQDLGQPAPCTLGCSALWRAGPGCGTQPTHSMFPALCLLCLAVPGRNKGAGQGLMRSGSQGS